VCQAFYVRGRDEKDLLTGEYLLDAVGQGLPLSIATIIEPPVATYIDPPGDVIVVA